MAKLQSDATPCLLRASFPAEPRSAPAARRAMRRSLENRIADDVLDTLLLCTTELVSNATRVAGPIELRVVVQREAIRVEVADRDCSALPHTVERDTRAESGRGLRIVDSLAHAWGTTWTPPEGKIVWFSLPLEVNSAA